VDKALEDESWFQVMREELDQFEKNEVWTLVSPPQSKSIIGAKLVYKNKLDKQDNIVRNKAKLVAKGYSQREGIDYTKTYAHVAKL